jgi:hypothetical protein
MKIIASNYKESDKNCKAQTNIETTPYYQREYPLHDYSNKTIRFYLFPIENPGHARFSLLHCTHPISGIWRSFWGSFSKCNSLLWPQILHNTPDIFLPVRILWYPYIYSQIYVGFCSKNTFCYCYETNEFCLNTWVPLKRLWNGSDIKSAIDFSIACKWQFQ